MTEELRNQILGRLYDVLFAAGAEQIQDEGVVENSEDGTNPFTFAKGEYRSKIEFGLGTDRNALGEVGRVTDANGSTFMGLWFLSQTHRVLQELLDSGEDWVPGATAKIKELQKEIHCQLEFAKELPKFFQGDTQDVLHCPPETMGWWPLVDTYRLPALLPHWARVAIPTANKETMANNSDGDIWAWCMAIDENTPGILEYRHDITDPGIIEPLLGTSFQTSDLDNAAQALLEEVIPGSEARPIGSFYPGTGPGVEPFPKAHPQRFSGVVMSNILSSIPLLSELRPEYMEAIQNCVDFIQKASTMALNQDITWFQFAYDYDTIDVASMAYAVRAHKRIVEIDRPGFPHLFTPDILKNCEGFFTSYTELYIDLGDEIADDDHAQDYMTLVYCFNAMMNMRFVDSSLFEDDLVERLARLLLKDNPMSKDANGTGPYSIIDLGLTQVWASMSSVCFVYPPLAEAYALYLQQSG